MKLPHKAWYCQVYVTILKLLPFQGKQSQNLLCIKLMPTLLLVPWLLSGWLKKKEKKRESESVSMWIIMLFCPILVGTRVRPMVPWSVGRKMSRRARLWMSLLQDPWAQLQQSVAWNGSAIVGEKGNSTLAGAQNETAAPLDHSLPDRSWSWQDPHKGHCLGRKEGGKGFVWLIFFFPQTPKRYHLFKVMIWVTVDINTRRRNHKKIRSGTESSRSNLAQDVVCYFFKKLAQEQQTLQDSSHSFGELKLAKLILSEP